MIKKFESYNIKTLMDKYPTLIIVVGIICSIILLTVSIIHEIIISIVIFSIFLVISIISLYKKAYKKS